MRPASDGYVAISNMPIEREGGWIRLFKGVIEFISINARNLFSYDILSDSEKESYCFVVVFMVIEVQTCN